MSVSLSLTLSCICRVGGVCHVGWVVSVSCRVGSVCLSLTHPIMLPQRYVYTYGIRLHIRYTFTHTVYVYTYGIRAYVFIYHHCVYIAVLCTCNMISYI